MNYHLETVEKGDYIHIKFFGYWPKETGKQIMEDIFTTAVKSGHKKVLLDFINANYMEATTIMDYEEATTAAEFPEIMDYWFAVLCRPEEVKRFSFWETVAVNRGIRIKFFGQKKQAINWLQK